LKWIVKAGLKVQLADQAQLIKRGEYLAIAR